MPSIKVLAWVSDGRSDNKVMVLDDGIEKIIVGAPVQELAVVMACRKLPGPESELVVTVILH